MGWFNLAPGRVYCEMEGPMFLCRLKGGSEAKLEVIQVYYLYLSIISICIHIYNVTLYIHTHVSFINAACKVCL